ncbi:MAG: beta-fructosidase [Nodosilinea sp.]
MPSTLPPSMQHPSRHVWDFWYYFDAEAKLFHLFYLNADRALVATGQHHFASRVGHATTADFSHIDWGDEDSFSILNPPVGHWANTSIWSGDVVRVNNGYLMFYTSRDRGKDDGMTQSIGVAHATNLASSRWHIFETQIMPKADYQTKGLASDLTLHAWRDPFLFRLRAGGQIFMLASAKLAGGPVGRNGAIALLKVSDQDFAQVIRGQREWDYLSPIVKPACYPEMEVPQLYQTPQGDYQLLFSTSAKNDFSPTTNQSGGLQGVTIPKLWNPARNGIDLSLPAPNIHVLLPERHGLYACRVIPELGGEIIGFDSQAGGIRRSGIKTHFQSMDRDFSDLAI